MRRSPEEIEAEILELCKEQVSVTHIVYKANLNFKTLKSHLNRLKADGLIAEILNGHTHYQTTEKGLKALGHIHALKDLFKPI